jgi:hypothetical protein
MVDYNIAIPQQQLFQAPDVMQNAMRMQQMDQLGATSRLRNMQADQLRAAQQQTAAERAQIATELEDSANALRGGASPTEAARGLTTEGKLGAAARVSAHGEALSKGQQAELDIVGNTLKGYNNWGATIQTPEDAATHAIALYKDPNLGKYMERFGIRSPQEAAQKAAADFAKNPELYRQSHSNLSPEALVTARKPVYIDLPGGGKGLQDPNNPRIVKEVGVEELGAPPTSGRVDTYPVSPARVADMNAAAGRTGGAPIINDGGQVARADMGLSPAGAVNAMAPVQPSSPYGAAPVANAMVPQQPGVVSTGVLAQRAKEKEMADALVKVGQETLARERATATVKGETETKTRQETAGRVLQALNDPEIDKLIKNSTSGALGYGLAAAKGAVTGTSTPGMENIGRLAAIQDSLLFRLANGKLGGGFTDKDTETIRNMLGRIADPTTPSNVRVKTLQDVRAMMKSVSTGENMSLAPSSVAEVKSAAPAGERPPLSSFGGR